MPNVDYWCQKSPVPGLSLPPLIQASPLSYIPRPGQKITFDPLNISFKVDEDLKNYMEIFDWIIKLGFPDNTSQYKAIKEQPIGYNEFSDASLMILDSAKNPNIVIKFYDLFPIGLSELNFDTTNSDVHTIECNATFAYRKFEFEQLNS